MRTVCTIEARMGSTRLPGKVLAEVAGKPLLAHMVERLKRVRELDEIVIATTLNVADDPIIVLARELDIGCFRGSEDDVLQRVLLAAEANGADVVVETTGDCPLIDPSIVSEVIRRFLCDPVVDYCSNIIERTFPDGMDVEVFWMDVLSEADRYATDPADREHVSTYIYHHPQQFRLRNVRAGTDRSDVRLTVDTPADLALVRTVFDGLYPDNPQFGLADILELFPDLCCAQR